MATFPTVAVRRRADGSTVRIHAEDGSMILFDEPVTAGTELVVELQGSCGPDAPPASFAVTVGPAMPLPTRIGTVRVGPRHEGAIPEPEVTGCIVMAPAYGAYHWLHLDEDPSFTPWRGYFPLEAVAPDRRAALPAFRDSRTRLAHRFLASSVCESADIEPDDGPARVRIRSANRRLGVALETPEVALALACEGAFLERMRARGAPYRRYLRWMAAKRAFQRHGGPLVVVVVGPLLLIGGVVVLVRRRRRRSG